MAPLRSSTLIALRGRYKGAEALVCFAAFRLMWELRYSPDQPRDDRGRWTEWDHSVDDESAIQPAQYREGSDLVDLREEEPKGGHAIRDHVSKSDNYLLSRARDLQQMARDRNNEVDPDKKYTGGVAAGTFPSLDAANRLVNATIAANRDQVEAVESGVSGGAQIELQSSAPTGTEAFAPSLRSQPYIRDTYATRVIIARDPSSDRGWRIETAFPIRSRERY